MKFSIKETQNNLNLAFVQEKKCPLNARSQTWSAWLGLGGDKYINPFTGSRNSCSSRYSTY